MNYFVHPQGLCESEHVGAGTRVWAFAHVLPGARVGGECNICDNVFIEGGAIVGDRVTLKCGVQLWDGVELEDDVFVGPNATFTNDRFPRSKHHPEAYARTIVRRGASIGANATILPGIVIGQNAMVGAGAVVTSSVPPNAIVVGNPARIAGYVNDIGATQAPTLIESGRDGNFQQTGIRGVTLHRLPMVGDLRGHLSVGEFERDIPFKPARYFLVYDVPTEKTRGEHAHRECHQFLVCARGSVAVVADDGKDRVEVTLDGPGVGVYLPPMTWGIQYKYSADAVLLVFASHFYDAADYIRDYDTFLKEVNAQG
ncbi:WxcM-like domain-containing protein [Paraburkholderia fungorum]|jgi:UDP-2-acetamido-3-amino-2,3-dideoxy-glucuronate N-acetyltransferase|uniref:WxcM-like domain-containing protein n=1 Tax=Paraburkholderia fungorum TaxID=134537 RepID=UPI000DB0A5B4|nr:WxcM-like domain-containing protein [Paraburkholderia fungorum]PZR43058.1 MAG: isomerase [Paraburkholderia fungorum]